MADKLSKANSAILSIVSQHQESNIETFPEPHQPTETIIDEQIKPIPQTSPELINVPPQSVELNPNTFTLPKTKPPLDTITEPVNDLFTAADLQAAILSNHKKQKMTERKKRVSYYFDPGTIEMVDMLANKTGWDKYEIVELAVKELYRQVIKE